MNFIQKIYHHWKLFWMWLFGSGKEETDSEEKPNSLEKVVSEELVEKERERINLAKRTMLSKLYMLEQEIAVLQNNFPTEFQAFQSRIDNLREDYQTTLEEVKKELRFEINPEQDSLKQGQVVKLEKDIEKFLQKEVKFHILSQQLQRLIAKLNILYNVAIFHTTEKEKASIKRQLSNALAVETRLASDFLSCDYILEDEQLKERIVNLLSYVDYHIFKTNMRATKQTFDTTNSSLVLLAQFENFDEESALVAFLKDELSDLMELLSYIREEELQKNLQKEADKVIANLTVDKEKVSLLSENAIWNQFFHFETTLLSILKASGVEKEKTKVALLARMQIAVEEEDVLTLPSTNAFLALVSVFATTQNMKVLLLLKLLKRTSKEVTYKEIYFLALLFDVLGVIENTENSLKQYLEKYKDKYPYAPNDIWKKKLSVLGASNHNYVVAFSLDECQKEMVQTLTSLKLDFKVEEDRVLLNSYYFGGMPHVLASLQSSSK